MAKGTSSMAASSTRSETWLPMLISPRAIFRRNHTTSKKKPVRMRMLVVTKLLSIYVCLLSLLCLRSMSPTLLQLAIGAKIALLLLPRGDCQRYRRDEPLLGWSLVLAPQRREHTAQQRMHHGRDCANNRC